MYEYTFNDLETLVISNIRQGIVPLLLAEAGIGKSAFIKNIGKKLNTKVNVLSINMLGSKEDLTGARMMKDEHTGTYRQVFFPHADVQDIIDYANAHPDETPILFLDEINRTTTDITDSCMQLITERKIGTTELPENVRLVSAGNDTGNISHLDTAKISRFAIYHVVPDAKTFINNIKPAAKNRYIEDTLNANPKLILSMPASSVDTVSSNDDDYDDDEVEIYEYDDKEAFDQFTTPRTLEYLGLTLNDLGLTKTLNKKELTLLSHYINPTIDVDLLRAIIQSHIGDTLFSRALYQNILDAFMNAQSSGVNNMTSNVTLSSDIITELNDKTSVSELVEYLNSLDTSTAKNVYLYTASYDGYANTILKQVADVILDNLREDCIDKDFTTRFADLIVRKNVSEDAIPHLKDTFDRNAKAVALAQILEIYSE